MNLNQPKDKIEMSKMLYFSESIGANIKLGGSDTIVED